MSLLEVSNLDVRFGDTAVVSGLGFAIDAGESVGLVGESGSGKTQTALAILGLTPRNAVTQGRVVFDGTDIATADAATLGRVRAERIGIVFQDPALALNPYVSIGRQLRRVLIEHGLADGKDADVRVLDMLERVGLPDPRRQFRAYPHQLSGGMRQRAMIASALIAGPDLLIADEPTTALDVTVQAQILELLGRIREDTALLLITHDLAVVAGHCERMLVLEQGRLIEEGPTRRVFAEPTDPRTAALIAAAPRLDATESPPPVEGETVLGVSDLSVSYRERGRQRRLHAVCEVSFELRSSETIAIVGESGSGKSSLVRSILGLIPVGAGRVAFCGKDIGVPVQARAIDTRRDLQLVFQDPAGSLNPQLRVEQIVAEPLTVHEVRLDEAARRQRVVAQLERVGLDASYLRRFPHELSGGQAQRIAIARALIVNPRVLVCDEAVAALDGTVRRQILDLLVREQRETGLAIVFIAHDLAVVRLISHRVLVLYLGRFVEVADGESLFERPRHPYTRALLDAVPAPDPLAPGGRPSVSGEVPSILTPPPGCAFHPRCSHAQARCREELPRSRAIGDALVACHRAEEI